MASIPVASSRSVGSAIKVSASDIKPTQTTLPQGGSTEGLDAGARALTALGASASKATDMVAAAGAIDQRNDDIDALEKALTEQDKFNLDATYGSVSQPQAGGVAGQLLDASGLAQAGTTKTPGYRDLQGQTFLDGKDNILGSSEENRVRIRGTLRPDLQSVFDRKSQAGQDAFRVKVENYGVQQKEAVRQETVKAEADFAIDSHVKESMAVLEDGGSVEEMIWRQRHNVERMVDITIRDLDARGVTDETQREQEIKNAVEAMHLAMEERLLAERLTKPAREYLKASADILGEMTAEGKSKVLVAIRAAENANITALTDTVNELITVYDAGGTPDAAVENQVRAALATSSGERAKIVTRKLNEASTDGKVIRASHDKTFAERNADIRAMEEKVRTGTSSASEVRQLAKLQKDKAHADKELKAGRGLALAQAYGVIPSLNTLQPSSAASYRQRLRHAAVASAKFGQYVSPLHPAELKSITDAIVKGEKSDGSTSSPDETAGMVQAMALGLGADGAAALASEAVRENDIAAYIIGNAPDRPVEWIREVIQGQRVLDKLPDLKPKAEDIQGVREAFFGNTFTPDTLETLPAYEAAAMALYVARVGEKGKTQFDDVVYKQALEEVTGGILEWGNQKLIAPLPGMTQNQLDKAMAALTPEDLITGSANGQPPLFTNGETVPVTEFDKPFFSSGTDAQLETIGPGRYGVIIPGSGPALTADGSPYELNLRGLIEGGLIEKPSRDVTAPELSPKAEPFRVTPGNFATPQAQKRSEPEEVEEAPAVEEEVGTRQTTPEEVEETPVGEQPQTVAQLKLDPFGLGTDRVSPAAGFDVVADLWGKVYQTESDEAKEADFVQDVQNFMDQASDTALERLAGIRDTIAEVFAGDEDTDLGKVQSAATQIAVHESEGLTKVKQIGGGPGRGIFQVELDTAKSLIFSSDLIGPKAIAKLAEEGWDITKNFTDKQMSKFLENDVISTVFGTAKLLSGAKAKGELAALQGEEGDTTPLKGGTAADDPSLVKKIMDAVNPISSAKADDIAAEIPSGPPPETEEGVIDIASKFIGGLVASTKDAVRKFEAIPQPVQLVVMSALPFSDRMTFKKSEIDPATQDVISGLVAEADRQGVNSVPYEFYPELANGLSAKAMLGDASRWDAKKKDYIRQPNGKVKFFAADRKKYAAQRKAVYGTGLAGKVKMFIDMQNDPVFRAAGTLGRFSIQSNAKGRFIKERFNFNTKNTTSGDNFASMRKFFSSLGTSVTEDQGPLVVYPIDGSVTEDELLKGKK